MIYVLDINGKPLMPTKRYGFVRHMLKEKRVKIVKRDPFFTIQLQYESDSYVQKLSAGMDIGETIGVSVITDSLNEVLSAEIKTRSKTIPSKLEEKAMYRRTRRARLRHRKKRFENRSASLGICKGCGGNTKSGKEFCSKCLENHKHQDYSKQPKLIEEKRYAPSVKHQINSHFKIIEMVNEILPLSEKNWTVEKTKFDIQKINNPDIGGIEYQQGDMWGFTNVREFVLERDNHTCQNPNCKHKNKKIEKNENIYIKRNIVLQIHHIRYRSNGGTDKPNNLITLCIDCHTPANHKQGQFLWDWNVNGHKVPQFKGATKMNVVSSAFSINKTNINYTYGSYTKRKRQLFKLPKTHANDAFAIAVDNKIFQVVEDNGEKKLIIGGDNEINKLTPLLIIQTNGRENGRRSLSSFFDSKFVDNRDNEIKSGGNLARIMNKRTLIENNRVYRGNRVSKGKVVKRTGKSRFSKGSVIKFTYEGKTYVKTCGGMTGGNVYVDNFQKKIIAVKKSNIHLITPRKGFILSK